MTSDNKTLFKSGMVIDNKWIIIEEIGKGAMGEVYRAHQINLKRDVAIKTIAKEMLQELEGDPEELEIAFKRFHREVQTMAQVRHPNILNIYDYGVTIDKEKDQVDQPRALEYIVMEYIPGNSLRFTMSDDGLDDDPELYASWIKSYFFQILDGVEAMHHHNIFHRDLKPENIFMDGKIPKIADFGLARSYKMKAVSNSMEMKGTLTYMAPEQFTDFRKADQTADIYALGKLLFEGVDGKLDQKTLPMKTVGLTKYKNIDIPFLKEMDAIIQKATAEDKNMRFQSVAELRTRLTEAMELSRLDPEVSCAPVPGVSTPGAFKAGAVEFAHIHSKWIWLGIIFAVLSVVGMTAWYMFGNPGNLNLLKSNKIDSNYIKMTLPDNLKDLKDTILGSDGSRMILTGNIGQLVGNGTGNPSKNPLFYMDEKKITNYLFVDFLNEIEREITVENAVVKHNGVVIFYLGTGTRKEDQITYQYERFHLKNQDRGGDSVTRVTYHGALEYAQYYGRTLLTESEWKFAYLYYRDKYLREKSGMKQTEPVSTMMEKSFEKKFQIKEIPVLDQMGFNIKEWVHHVDIEQPTKQVDNIHLFASIMDSKMVETGSETVLRQQWEGFPDVGFRTKIRIK
ncbi:MAG: serine/threonine protein kinase [Desulfobacteraceae bacterium]|nr:serine/threonine protein kinase [Desulfobacteraceae bacterium]